MAYNIVFFPGRVRKELIDSIFTNNNLNTLDVFLPNVNKKKEWKNYDKGKVCLMHDFFDVNLYSQINLTQKNKEIYGKTIDSLFSDSRSFFLFERIFKFKKENSIFNISGNLSVFVLNSIKHLQNQQTDLVFCLSTPHHLSWFFSYCAEFMGMKVVYTQTSPIPFKKWIVQGIKDPETIHLNGETSKEELSNWISKLQSDYSDAIPEYEKKRNIIYKHGDSNIISNLNDIIFKSQNNSVRYNKLLNLGNKLGCLKLYEKLASKKIAEEKYIVFFLHYQPERTSLPEGRDFAQQMKIILDIHLNLPKGFKLIVKEHPSMFRNNFNIRVRFPDFYKNISKLPNVSLASLSIESFDLIDKSNGVVTITGTVGVEALLRDKPVMVYGDAQFKKFRNVYNQREDKQKRLFFDNLNIINSEANISSNAIEDLNEVDKFSFFTENNGISKKAINKYLHYMFSKKRNER